MFVAEAAAPDEPLDEALVWLITDVDVVALVLRPPLAVELVYPELETVATGADEVLEVVAVVPVVVAATAEVGVDALVVAAVAPVEQLILSGRLLTPLVEQRSWANVIVDSWSAALHAEARQHAMLDKKLEFPQIQLISREAHPAMVPLET